MPSVHRTASQRRIVPYNSLTIKNEQIIDQLGNSMSHFKKSAD
ncbi:hypothetical protein ND16A_1982 [Thalassotalea sp. ND16A]|nr:hypothetical protein ND16A_1982 [Thalassotalea sp. ND16A]